jgi:CBS domain-containing protein
MKVREIMVQPVIVVKENTTLEEIAQIMLNHRIGCVPVVDKEDKIVGIVTESDFTAREHAFPFSIFFAPQLFGKWMSREGIEEIYKTARTMTAREIMSTSVITLKEDDSVEEVVKKMLHYDINRIPVARDGVPVGIVARHDLLKLILRNKELK